jgi:hypothetical protein
MIFLVISFARKAQSINNSKDGIDYIREYKISLVSAAIIRGRIRMIPDSY